MVRTGTQFEGITSIEDNYVGPWETSPVARDNWDRIREISDVKADHEAKPAVTVQRILPQPESNKAELNAAAYASLKVSTPMAPIEEKVAAVSEPVEAVISQEVQTVKTQAPSVAPQAVDTPKSEATVSEAGVGTQAMVGGDLSGEDPGKYKWCTERYVAGCSNHWMPDEVPMGQDVFQWKNREINAQEKRAMERVLGFFSTADSLAANNIVLGLMRHMTSKQARRYMVRQAYEEAIHTHTYQHIVQSLGLDERAIFNAYHEVPTIMAKDKFLTPFIDTLCDPDFVADTPEQKKKLLTSVIMFAGVMEGMFFYAGFSNIFALKKDNKMPGSAKQIQFIARDESLHSRFGMDVAKTIMAENPGLFDDQMKEEIKGLFEQAVSLEEDFILEMCTERTFSINPQEQIDYSKYIMNRRAQQLGMEKIYPDINECPIPWMSNMLDLKQEQNFFEGSVSEYQDSANLTWDDGDNQTKSKTLAMSF